MDQDTRLLVQALFMQATIVAEEASNSALDGQSLKRARKEYGDLAAHLLQTGEDLIVMARAVEVVLKR